jgi:hypothetical protein
MGLLLEMPISENIDSLYACKCNCKCKPTFDDLVISWYPEAEFTWFKKAEDAFTWALMTGNPVTMVLSFDIDERV